MGVVHHPRYLIYFEIARTRYMSDLGMQYSELMHEGTYLAVTDAGAKYLRPAFYEDELVVSTRCSELSGTRIGLEYEVRRGDELIATGHTRLGSVGVDGRARRLPVEVRETFAAVLEPSRE